MEHGEKIVSAKVKTRYSWPTCMQFMILDTKWLKKHEFENIRLI